MTLDLDSAQRRDYYVYIIYDTGDVILYVGAGSGERDASL
jgi:hypothetical protein